MKSVVKIKCTGPLHQTALAEQNMNASRNIFRQASVVVASWHAQQCEIIIGTLSCLDDLYLENLTQNRQSSSHTAYHSNEIVFILPVMFLAISIQTISNNTN